MPPVVAGLLSLGAEICDNLPVRLVHWWPSELANGPAFFGEAVRDYANGGAFPALSLVRFEKSGASTITTNGLDWFVRQEIAFDTAGLDEASVVKRLVRLLHDIVENGPLMDEMLVDGLQAGERLQLLPSDDGHLVYAKLV